MQIGNFSVTGQRKLAPGLFVIEGRLDPQPSEPVEPGHFIHIKVDEPGDFKLLWRPMSFLDYRPEDNYASIYYRVEGEGSRKLAQRSAGEDLVSIYPVGKGFERDGVESAVFVAGGVGIAPLLMLYRFLDAETEDLDYRFIFGAESAQMLTPEWIEGDWGVDALFTTEDSSLGHHGLVTDLLPGVLKERDWDMLYTCGPNPMMAAVQELVPASQPAQASMEAPMACSIGVCNGCNVPLRERGMDWPVRMCVEGPVFGLHEIDFDTIEHAEGRADLAGRAQSRDAVVEK